MPLVEVIKNELDSKEIAFDYIETEHPYSFYNDATKLGIPLDELARATVVEAHGENRLLVLRAGDMLDFSSLNTIYGKSISIASNHISTIEGCDPQCKVPLPGLQDLEIVIDQSIFTSEYIYFDAGIKGSYIKVKAEDFKRLHLESTFGEFSCPAEKLYNVSYNEEQDGSSLKSFTPMRIQQRVEETFDLPTMPAIAQEVMRIRIDPKAGASDLAKIVAQDPSLSAQVISWASSPYYGYQGQIDSIATAISRVLGFDLVLNLALGISVGKSLNVSNEGPLGLNAYWKQSVYAATLSEKLCSFIRGKNRPQRGLVYLSGLLHNIGQLLLGHLFPPQFYLINKYVEMNPHIPIANIERYLLGISHVEVGAWLMESWNMPDELIAAVRWHHDEDYEGENAVYSNIVLLANRLLKRLEIGDSTQILLPEKIMAMVGINEKDAFKALDLIVEDEIELDAIAQQMVA
ncbi:MAG: HD-like signal output (HDOD) protein/prolyl-tRNA editing enzyme YbaK/EbsC (Cys-tRNA(Pro) deacylase) [Enterobacterales bacterium]|jgi:HD-like signal output (HDOD) protein/prolyl-tRNA editing enzyme YbaK/EbsC (Cys-tRNA(Pro) deacylase)